MSIQNVILIHAVLKVDNVNLMAALKKKSEYH